MIIQYLEYIDIPTFYTSCRTLHNKDRENHSDHYPVNLLKER